MDLGYNIRNYFVKRGIIMKKFLLFLVVIVVAVSLGLTTYYFMRNDETISVDAKEIYCNVGDIITLDEIGITIKKPSKKTTFDYNAGGEKVTSLVKYDEQKGHYNVLSGGETQLIIKTSNSRCPEFRISLHIGDGGEANPYNIEDQEDLEQMGSAYALSGDNAHYAVRKQIVLSNEFKPIGYDYKEKKWVGFSGTFNGNGNEIIGLKQTGDYDKAGLFYSLNDATVTNLVIKNANISGNYTYAGVLTGYTTGTVTLRALAIENSKINTTATDAVVGGLVGLLSGENSSLSVGYADKVDITLTGENVVAGGLVGELNLATVQATYASNKITSTNGLVGGLVGKFVIDADNGAILESYSTTTSENADFASFVSTIVSPVDITGMNVLKYLAGNIAVTNGKQIVKTYNDALFTTFYDDTHQLFFIREFENENALIGNDEYFYYGIHSNNIRNWDNVWNTENLPTLNMTTGSITALTQAYLKKDVRQISIDKNDLLTYLNSGTINDAAYQLSGDIDFEGAELPAASLVNSVINGNGYTISNFKIVNGTVEGDYKYCGLFSKVENSSIYNLKLENVAVDIANAEGKQVVVGGVAGSLTSGADVSDAVVVYANVETARTGLNYFGGVVGIVGSNAQINNGSVETLALNNARIGYTGGVVALNSGVVNNCKVGVKEVATEEGEATQTAVTLSGMNAIGGAVAVNNGSVSGLQLNVEITNSNYNNGANSLAIGTVVANNYGPLANVQANAKITVVKTDDNVALTVGGVVANNSGAVENVTVSGEGVTINADVVNAYVGGVVAVNSGSITGARNYLNRLNMAGEYANKNICVGGVAYTNNGAIAEVVTTSDINGNIVAGVVVEQNNSSARIDKVLVGKFNPQTKQISDNSITGDRYVAGVAYRLMQGSVENVQAVSALRGLVNDTRTSLVVLEFPSNASLKNSTINSSLAGYGTFYKDAWVDFTQSGSADHYNIYSMPSAAGAMESVVINTEKARSNGINNIQQGVEKVNKWLGLVETSSSYQSSSFVKDVNNGEFTNAGSFKGDFSYELEHTYTKTLTFNFTDAWNDAPANGGVALRFLDSLN